LSVTGNILESVARAGAQCLHQHHRSKASGAAALSVARRPLRRLPVASTGDPPAPWPTHVTAPSNLVPVLNW